MRCLLGFTVAMGMIVAAAGATTPAAQKKLALAGKTSAAKKSPIPRKPLTAIHRAANRKKATPAKAAVTWRTRQLAPSSDRYEEIQQALAAKGYLQPEEATGSWDQNSTDALKRFQAEQNLSATGKINSLSLIALGLGPKHGALPTQIAAPEDSRR